MRLHPSRRPRGLLFRPVNWSVVWVLLAAFLIGCLVGTVWIGGARAEGGQEDPIGAIYAAAQAHDIDPGPLIDLARCESRFSPTARGDQGRSRGLFQLNDRDTGLWHHFTARGYSDVDSAEQSADYVARVAAGEWRREGITLRRWTCSD